MGTFKEHLDLANERFDSAERLFGEGLEHTAAHLFVNAVVNYHNAACLKFLGRLPGHKQHSDVSYFKEIAKFIGEEYPPYKAAYEFLMSHKSQVDYDVGLSLSSAEQIRRRARKVREIIEPLL
ncbi:Uncharacterised protein [uncultured archaeon]|nr:Uncharacterised protein [uncultured archaeon]